MAIAIHGELMVAVVLGVIVMAVSVAVAAFRLLRSGGAGSDTVAGAIAVFSLAAAIAVGEAMEPGGHRSLLFGTFFATFVVFFLVEVVLWRRRIGSGRARVGG